jgi:hypothetical protein
MKFRLQEFLQLKFFEHLRVGTPLRKWKMMVDGHQFAWKLVKMLFDLS